MNVVNQERLRIRNAAVGRIKLHDTFVVATVKVWIILMPVVLVIMINISKYNEFLAEEQQLKLTYDYTEWAKVKYPPSSWVEKDHYINESDFHKSHWFDAQLFGMFVVSYKWNLVLIMLRGSVEFFFQFLLFLFQKLGWKKLLSFLLIGCIIYLIQFLGILNLWIILIKYLQNNIIEWMEKRIYDATLDMELYNSSARYMPHPLRTEMEPPFNLFIYERHLKEDVIFTCEYIVYSLQEAKPVFKTVNWRKDGSPVKINDRIYSNMSISIHREFIGFNEYSVISNLTIGMIEDSDFGAYTCDYFNPMVRFLYPGPRMYSGFKYPSSAPSDDTNFKSQCKPPDKAPPPCDSENSVKEKQSGTNEHRGQCWAEFQLKKRKEKDIYLQLSPGSILIDGASYHCETGEENLQFDVTFNNIVTQNTVMCCSPLVLLYWRFFREGFNEIPPFGRIIQGESSFLFLRYQCMCRSSYGTHQLTLYRHFVNNSDGTRDLVEIEYPVKLIVLPLLNSYLFDYFNLTFSERILECWDTGFASDSCHNFGQSFDFIVNIVLKYETFFASLIHLLIVFNFFFLVHFCMRVTAKPLLSVYFYYNKSDTLFESVEGPPVSNVKPCSVIQCQQSNKKYQFFLSYDNQDIDDKQIACSVRNFLLQKHFSVFDPEFDGTPGMPEMSDFCEAIKTSCRFIVLASNSYIANNIIEFESIQNVLIRENSKIKNRLFIIKTEPCDIDRLQSVPCIEWPIDQLKQMEQLKKFQLWEKATRPQQKTRAEIFKDKLLYLTHKMAFIRALVVMTSFMVLIYIGGQW